MEVKIGLEIHVQLDTESKLFCNCPTKRSEEANENTCPICLGFPGSKPVINKKAIDFGIMVARALNCKVLPSMFFSRKSYFYPDLPKNFQISQYEAPLATNGFLKISNRKIRIRRVHLEEDPGKLVHVGGTIASAQYVLVDYNRSGIPLVEIVTEPDFRSTKEVREFLFKLSSMLEHLEVYDPSKEASMRVDANISLKGGKRVEVKNITGFKNVERALNYEILRQKNLLRMGLKVKRETRHFDEASRLTTSLRMKEFEEDYGFIFEPDLSKIRISKEWIREMERKMPELPEKRIERIVKTYGIREREARIIVYGGKALADFFESCCKIYRNYKEIAKWLVTDLLKSLNLARKEIKKVGIEPKDFVELLELIDRKEITPRLAKELIKEIVSSEKPPRKILMEKKIRIVREKKEIEKVVLEVIKTNKTAVEDFLKGKKEALNFLVGEVMKRSKASIDPKESKRILKKFLKELG